MKKILSSILILISSFYILPYTKLFGQSVNVVLRGSKSDSSFYHLAKIKNNEFWAGGKYGILRSIDTLGNVSGIPFPNEGHDILKIERVKNHVFILTSNSVVFKYDIEKDTFIKISL